MRFTLSKRLRKPSARTVFESLIGAALVVSMVGCHWLRYYDLLETHVALMQGMANDTAEAVEAGLYRPRASEAERLGYPLLRARQFQAISADWDGIEASHAAFVGFVDAYAAFVDRVDRVRIDGVDAREKRQIVKSVRAVNDAAGEARACMICERDEAESCDGCRRSYSAE